MNKPLLVYVHIPFCRSKCHFCDWVQHIAPSELRLAPESSPRMAYLAALAVQARHQGEALKRDGYRPSILYWGGGTASILTCDEILRVADAVAESFDLEALDEATIETSPETLTPEKLRTFRDVGFRRISIGVQVFDDDRLRRIGRSHTSRQAEDAIRMARDAGFEAINVDLISGFPDESLSDFERSLQTALRLPFDHVSLYPYRPAGGTVMANQLRSGWGGTVRLEEQLAAYASGSRMLAESGFGEYAFSHFGRPECLSDLAYFQLRMDWVGLGSGATSLLRTRYLATERGQLHRFIRQPAGFDEDVPASEGGIATRLMYQSLTTPEGAVGRLWEERTGVPLAEIARQPLVASLLDYFRSRVGLDEDQAGIRIPRDQIARAFIELQFLRAPDNAKAVTRIEHRVGAY